MSDTVVPDLPHNTFISWIHVTSHRTVKRFAELLVVLERPNDSVVKENVSHTCYVKICLNMK